MHLGHLQMFTCIWHIDGFGKPSKPTIKRTSPHRTRQSRSRKFTQQLGQECIRSTHSDRHSTHATSLADFEDGLKKEIPRTQRRKRHDPMLSYYIYQQTNLINLGLCLCKGSTGRVQYSRCFLGRRLVRRFSLPWPTSTLHIRQLLSPIVK